jgi:tight adherence protein C
MILIFLTGIVFVGIAFGLFARALVYSRHQSAETISQIDSYGFEADGRAVSVGSSSRQTRHTSPHGVVDSIATKLGGALLGHSRSLSEEGLRHLLMAAGYYTQSPRRFVGYQALGTLVLGGLWIWFAVVTNASWLFGIVGAVLALMAGWTLPVTYIKRRARSRAEQIDYAMPELIDMLIATIEAGISFGGSLQIATKRFRGPLGEELQLTLQEQSMGLGLNEALEHMAERCDTPSIRSFVRSLIQGEQLGVSVGQTLRNLAHDMRARRRALAEERAQKAPVKLVFPLVLFIFPSLMIVALGPAFIRIHQVFHG